MATWGHLFVLAVLLNSAPFTLFAYGETHISAVLAGIINALAPLATLLAALTIFRQQRPNPKIIAGLAVGFAGVLVFVGVWHGLGRGQLLGIGACLGAVACYGIAFPYSHRHLTGLADPPVALATGQVLCGAVQLLPFAVIVGAAFLSEAVTWYEPVGGVLILAGAAISQDRIHRPRKKSSATPCGTSVP